MAPTVPVGFPAALVAGTTWTFSVSFSDFPQADGWALTYQLLGRTSGSFSATGRPASNDFLVTVASTTTANFLPGLYRWTALASLGGATYVAGSGVVDVGINPAVTANTDLRSHAELMLEKVENEIQARFGTATTPLGSAHESYTIGGRNITKISLPDLQSMRASLILEIEKQRNSGNVPPYEISFARPT